MCAVTVMYTYSHCAIILLHSKNYYTIIILFKIKVNDRVKMYSE